MSYELELLARVIMIAEKAIEPPPNVSVPMSTLTELGEQINRALEGSLIGDEAAMVTQCLINAGKHQAAGELERATRWRVLAKCFLPFLRTDLALHIRQARAHYFAGGEG